jgi:phosphatidylglycerophosphate synthase
MIADLISLSRLVLAAAFVYFAARPAIAVAILSAAGISDWLDGWVAKRHGQGTRLGVVIDPVCDRIFIVTVLTTLVVVHGLPPWQLAVLITRDILNTLGVAAVWALRPAGLAELRPLRSGKVVTSLQFWCVVHVVLALPFFPVAFAAVVLATAWAIGDYFRQFRLVLGASKSHSTP